LEWARPAAVVERADGTLREDRRRFLTTSEKKGFHSSSQRPAGPRKVGETTNPQTRKKKKKHPHPPTTPHKPPHPPKNRGLHVLGHNFSSRPLIWGRGDICLLAETNGVRENTTYVLGLRQAVRNHHT